MSADENHTLRSELRHLKVLEGPLLKCDFETFPNTPQAAFEMWVQEAIEAGVKEPHAMTLSTVDDQGWPDARVLILKNVDARGWHFAVKGNSPKGKQLATNPYAALTFYWPEQGRQVRIRGRAVQLPEGECRQDFLDRPLSSKIAALASQQSQVLERAHQVQQAVESVRQEFEENDDFPLPDWKVYAVDPIAVEFWQGAKDRLHQRLRYKHESAEEPWEKQLLWP
ncbi:Pyridoxamine 5 -phosphate oxidase [Fusarium falciforme]|uniref:Pyridoxamine 5 -phosphate oxidase n=1 Tax=Fusarium falciforme TaxID=195108 RepID=UPI0023016D1A|nr:Pyridoxamine 5 -phosphate oxidase [Fusarium falciforme]WAO84289.1 Pyridoxamine 5 -phosphate oxidase [Fusarium falciforme]